MKKLLLKITFCILFLSSLLFLHGIIYANDIDNMLIDVKIIDDGRFRIMETWEGNFYEGTENYKSISTSKVKITDFQVGMLVRDKNGNEIFNEFTYDPDYDINSSFEKKKNKCGINVVGNDVELCFGITNYGKNIYVMSYVVDPGVVSYTDYDGFNYMFVNPGLNTPIKHLSTRIMLQNGVSIGQNNARIWAFGSKNGNINFSQGSVICDISNFNKNNYQTIMLRLDKGLINPKSTSSESFSSVQGKAFEKSDYKGGIDLYTLLYTAIIAIAGFSIVYAIVTTIRNAIEREKLYKEVNYFRDNPNNNNIGLNAAIINEFPIGNVDKFDLIGALMLKMINEKNLEHIEEKDVGLFGIEKKKNSLKLVKEPTDTLANKLYTIIKTAAGADEILQEKELEKYALKNGEVIEDFVDNALSGGRSEFHKLGGYQKICTKAIRHLTDTGRECVSEVYGLRKFLDEFTLISEREIKEIEIWDDYLVYAQLFGIGDKVIKQLKKLYPDNIKKINDYSTSVYMSDLYFRSLTRGIHSYRASKMSKSEISGFGGGMSLGGGGGFSGGGFGGGSR